MAKRPYFSITRESFEKNAGYKSTVHALAELVDNAFEASAKNVTIVLRLNRPQQLDAIAVGDDGTGMTPELLQMAVCEKAGKYLSRQWTTGSGSRRKLGKYGVGLPKSSISQCNRFTVWSWTAGLSTSHRNGIDILDKDWIDSGAQVEESVREDPPTEWLAAARLTDASAGTLVLWEDLDGLTWSRARWGQHSGLIPNIEFDFGRVYRKLITGPDPEFTMRVVVLDQKMKEKEEPFTIGANDPLYVTPGLNVPKETLEDGALWPPDDPLFDEITKSVRKDTEMAVEVPLRDGNVTEVQVRWRASAARKDTFAELNGLRAGSRRHGKHAARNVGLSILREGREIAMSMALASPSEPRERWFGVELDLPHELDAILGMTNNKQEYTRLERILSHTQDEYREAGESTRECLDRIEREDPDLAICLRIAWVTQDVWRKTKSTHLNMREDVLRRQGPDEGPKEDVGGRPEPEEEAETSASGADPEAAPQFDTQADQDQLRSQLEDELLEAGIPAPEAKQMAARVVDRGLAYMISARSGLGSPFFSVSKIKGIKLIQLNTDHPAYSYIRSSIDRSVDQDVEHLGHRLENARVAMLLVLEAWGKLEAEADPAEERQMQRMREDWGRLLEKFILQLREDRAKRGDAEE